MPGIRQGRPSSGWADAAEDNGNVMVGREKVTVLGPESGGQRPGHSDGHQSVTDTVDQATESLRMSR
jgi:hypothetical protein